MCRNIRTLHNYDPPATEEEVYASALQFVRKISGAARPSKQNEKIFYQAVDEVCEVTKRLLETLETNAAPRNREMEMEKTRQRNRERFGN